MASCGNHLGPFPLVSAGGGSLIPSSHEEFLAAIVEVQVWANGDEVLGAIPDSRQLPFGTLSSVLSHLQVQRQDLLQLKRYFPRPSPFRAPHQVESWLAL